jgi:hypothetical protein
MYYYLVGDRLTRYLQFPSSQFLRTSATSGIPLSKITALIKLATLTSHKFLTNNNDSEAAIPTQEYLPNAMFFEPVSPV